MDFSERKKQTRLPGLGFVSFGEKREDTRWPPGRPPARAQAAAVVMVVIIRAPIARAQAGSIMQPRGAATDAVWNGRYGMKRPV